MTAQDPRTDLAHVIADAARADGWIMPPSVCLRIADAIALRPGLIRALLVPANPETTESVGGIPQEFADAWLGPRIRDAGGPEKSA